MFHIATNGRLAIVKVLLDHGADIDAQDPTGRTPIMFAGTHKGHNHVHLTTGLGFVTHHLWLGDFRKCNQGLRARTLRLRFPSAN